MPRGDKRAGDLWAIESWVESEQLPWGINLLLSLLPEMQSAEKRRKEGDGGGGRERVPNTRVQRDIQTRFVDCQASLHSNPRHGGGEVDKSFDQMRQEADLIRIRFIEESGFTILLEIKNILWIRSLQS
jgi:hypothetical protein